MFGLLDLGVLGFLDVWISFCLFLDLWTFARRCFKESLQLLTTSLPSELVTCPWGWTPLAVDPLPSMTTHFWRVGARNVFTKSPRSNIVSFQVTHIGGWGSETNREIVSVRSHARTRGLVVRSELGKKRLGPWLFPFPFWTRGSSSEFW